MDDSCVCAAAFPLSLGTPLPLLHMAHRDAYMDPKTNPKSKFCIFFDIFWAQDHVQGLLQAFRFNFPSKMGHLDAYVSSNDTFRRF